MNKEEFSIQFVARVTGINPHTLRAWEKRYKAVVPYRDDNGRRLYTQHDMDKLVMLFELVDMGNKISDIANLSFEDLKSMHKKFVGESKDVSQPKLKSIQDVDTHSTLQNLIMALKGYKLDIISHELNKVAQNLTQRDFALGIISPLLIEVGDLVEVRKLSIAQEHALSAILKFQIGKKLFQHFIQNNSNDSGIIFTTPEGEHHEFGILLSALLCSHYQINFQYLGSNLPLESLVDAAKQIKPKIIVVGISKSYHQSGAISLDEYIDKLVVETDGKSEVWVGGHVSPSKNLQNANVKIISSLRELDLLLANY